MAVHVNFNRTCDRCGKPFDLQRISYEVGLPKLDPNPWVLTHGGKQVFSFEDLCPSCEGVVGKLAKRMSLDEDKKDEDKKIGAGLNTDELTQPNVNEESGAVPEAGDQDPEHPF